MRVLGGIYRGRRLFMLPDETIRPTIARLKGSYFNIVQSRLAGACFLDLCAGSGAMGIEALSRGAGRVVFLDRSRTAAALIARNLQHCKIGGGFHIICGDLGKELPGLARRGDRFDLIYFDPPYFKDLYLSTLDTVSRLDLLKPDGWLAANHFKKIELPEKRGRLALFREVRQGDSVLSYYQSEEDEPAPPAPANSGGN